MMKRLSGHKVQTIPIKAEEENDLYKHKSHIHSVKSVTLQKWIPIREET